MKKPLKMKSIPLTRLHVPVQAKVSGKEIERGACEGQVQHDAVSQIRYVSGSNPNT